MKWIGRYTQTHSNNVHAVWFTFGLALWKNVGKRKMCEDILRVLKLEAKQSTCAKSIAAYIKDENILSKR